MTHPTGLGTLDDASSACQATLRECLCDILIGPCARQDPGGPRAGSKCECDGGQPGGGNTDTYMGFVHLLLLLAMKYRVPCKDMAKQLFVFLDMQFDQATRMWEDIEGWEPERTQDQDTSAKCNITCQCLTEYLSDLPLPASRRKPSASKIPASSVS